MNRKENVDMRSKYGIGFSKGYYYTDETTRKRIKEYRDAHDYIQFNCPLGTRERLKALGVKRQELLLMLAKDYIKEKSGSN